MAQHIIPLPLFPFFLLPFSFPSLSFSPHSLPLQAAAGSDDRSGDSSPHCARLIYGMRGCEDAMELWKGHVIRRRPRAVLGTGPPVTRVAGRPPLVVADPHLRGLQAAPLAQGPRPPRHLLPATVTRRLRGVSRDEAQPPLVPPLGLRGPHLAGGTGGLCCAACKHHLPPPPYDPAPPRSSACATIPHSRSKGKREREGRKSATLPLSPAPLSLVVGMRGSLWSCTSMVRVRDWVGRVICVPPPQRSRRHLPRHRSLSTIVLPQSTWLGALRRQLVTRLVATPLSYSSTSAVVRGYRRGWRRERGEGRGGAAELSPARRRHSSRL